MMMSYDKWQIERAVHHRRLTDPSPRPNGIACPMCGKELQDSTPLLTMTSNPPQKAVDCPACGWSGQRIA